MPEDLNVCRDGMFEVGLRETRVSAKFELRYESFRSKFSLIHSASGADPGLFLEGVHSSLGLLQHQ